jgi:acetyl-CoA carboxylase biotin carboxyl carrier protein
LSDSFNASDLEAVRRLLAIVTEHNLTELTVSLRDDISVTIKTATAPEQVVIPYAPQLQLTAPTQALLSAPASHSAEAHAPSSRAPRGTPVASPMVGMFYHAASPEDPPFVKIGDSVSVGQTIGLIEAMKVFSEIPSEVAGRVVDIVVSNGQLVQLGQALIYIE